MFYRLVSVLSAALLVTALACSPKPAAVSPIPSATGTTEQEVSGPDLFEDITAASGIDFAYRNGEEVKPPHLSILESLGGGVALIDYDRDGLLDIYIPGGGHFGGKDNKEILGHAGRLYRNLGNLKFKDVTAEVGLDRLAGGDPWFYSHAAAIGDYDRDGWPDMLVTGWRRIALFHNEPDGKGGRRFVDVSKKAGLDTGILWATSAAWADLDGDGLSDLYVCQYVDCRLPTIPIATMTARLPTYARRRSFKVCRTRSSTTTATAPLPT